MRFSRRTDFMEQHSVFLEDLFLYNSSLDRLEVLSEGVLAGRVEDGGGTSGRQVRLWHLVVASRVGVLHPLFALLLSLQI